MLDTDHPKTDEELEAWLNGIQDEAKSEVVTLKEDSLTGSTPHPYSFKREENPLQNYLLQMTSPLPLANLSLLVLMGLEECSQEMLAYHLLPEHYQKLTGGFYFRAGGKGFVVNPGPNFLEKLHANELHINAIDYVIVTSSSFEAFADAKAIYDLNYKCNLQSDSLHIIYYFLHQGAYKALAGSLIPHFKQEKDTIRCLELYMDSPDTESISLSDEVTLNYFTLGKTKETLGISLEILSTDLEREFSIGWISLEGCSEGDLALHNFANYDILIANVLDGQIGCLKGILQQGEQKNSLLLFHELAKKESDTRLLIAKTLKDSMNAKSRLIKTILPIDRGLLVKLHDLSAQCTSCGEYSNASEMHVAKSKRTFGKLSYLCSECCL